MSAENPIPEEYLQPQDKALEVGGETEQDRYNQRFETAMKTIEQLPVIFPEVADVFEAVSAQIRPNNSIRFAEALQALEKKVNALVVGDSLMEKGGHIKYTAEGAIQTILQQKGYINLALKYFCDKK